MSDQHKPKPKRALKRSKNEGGESDSESSAAKRKPAVKRHQHYLPSYTKAYPCIVASKVSSKYARCSVCDMDFMVSHGGMDDVARHVSSVRHESKAQALDKSAKLTKIFTPIAPSGTAVETAAAGIHAETLFAHYLVEHNIALSAADHAGELFRSMFPDSKIAQNYASGRTASLK
eukprot:TRINITY_DN21691_c0_g2_i2.p1 TRINITY_DN21691_c0_g2~~TRINITY_DN21691_c0_g2_i2.p1  ORF type:complete len:175 (-),score=12.30 TRINITY_DN21691_c0_g2_i2:227-751(-)